MLEECAWKQLGCQLLVLHGRFAYVNDSSVENQILYVSLHDRLSSTHCRQICVNKLATTHISHTLYIIFYTIERWSVDGIRLFWGLICFPLMNSLLVWTQSEFPGVIKGYMFFSCMLYFRLNPSGPSPTCPTHSFALPSIQQWPFTKEITRRSSLQLYLLH